MSKRKDRTVHIVDDTKVAIELIRAGVTLAQDPLISSLVAWYWVQKRSDLGIDDRAALRVGIIDINRARAGVESSIAIEMMDRAISLFKDIGSASALAGLTVANPTVGGALAGAKGAGLLG